MPGITSQEMNGYDYDQGSRGPVMANGYDPYRDEYQREDPYRRDEEDTYRGQSRRFGGDFVEQPTEPSFELDHLATFAAATRDGYIQPEDGLRKLRQMESTTGIWTMRCMLSVERRHLVILDNQTGEELERFPIQSVHSPTAIFNKDRREIYNNLILFTVGEDPKKRTQADMHIFQSVDTAAQNIVDEILVAQKGGQQSSYQSKAHVKAVVDVDDPDIISQKVQAPPPGRDMTYEFNGMKEFLNTQQQSSRLFGGGPSRGMMINRPYREEFEPGQNEVLERDVQLLNHCFDDIEKFVSRLQHAAESYKELEKRKRERNSKDKRRHAGEGLMSYRARPPPSSDFTDIFQKFKLSFNLLAKLKAHIHDPNAPELVHFLFTPLSLIYEASRDPAHGNQNLAESAIAPILTSDAKQLLLNCLTSKEIELWRALGSTWTTSRDEWKGYVPNYTPRFYDGWQPAPGAMENGFRPHADLESAALAQAAQARSRYEEEQARSFVSEKVVPFPPEEDRGTRYGRTGDYQRRDYERHSPRAPTPPKHAMGNPSVAGYRENIRAQEHQSRPENNSYSDVNATYLNELKSMGQAACEVIHDREGRNSKELTLAKGDIVGVLDSSRNWWKVRNSEGKVGFAPYTIMRELKEEEEHLSRDRPSSGNYNRYILNDKSVPDAPPLPASELNRGKRAKAKQGDFQQNMEYVGQMTDTNNDKYNGEDYYDTSPKQNHNTIEELRERDYKLNISPRSEYSDKLNRSIDKTNLYSKPNRRGSSPLPDDYSNSDGSYMDGQERNMWHTEVPVRSFHEGHRRNNSYVSETVQQPLHVEDRATIIRHRSDDEYSDSSYGPPKQEQNWQLQSDNVVKKKPPMPNYSSEEITTTSKQKSSRYQPATLPKPLSHDPDRTFQPVQPARQRDQPTHQLRHVPHQSAKPNKVQPHVPVWTQPDELRDEIKTNAGNRPEVTKPIHNVNHIDPGSPDYQVLEWLQSKGFSPYAVNTFDGYTGEDLFRLRKEEIERLIGREEGHHLESLLRVQKNLSGFGAARGGAELQAILQKRKEKADYGRTSSQFGQEPSFRPDTPQRNEGGSDVDELEFENTGKTLRDLLIRQRRKIMKSTYNQPYDE